MCRAIIAFSRAFQEVVIAIVFDAMFGFGPFVGAMTLAFSTICVLRKLLYEVTRQIWTRQVEAIQATGAAPTQVLSCGSWPQAMPVFAGIPVHRWDINIRATTMLGKSVRAGSGGVRRSRSAWWLRRRYR